MVQTRVIGRIAVQTLGCEHILQQRLLLVVITVIEKVGAHLGESQTRLFAIPSAGDV